jgi:hypothetical protein
MNWIRKRENFDPLSSNHKQILSLKVPIPPLMRLRQKTSTPTEAEPSPLLITLCDSLRRFASATGFYEVRECCGNLKERGVMSSGDGFHSTL